MLTPKPTQTQTLLKVVLLKVALLKVVPLKVALLKVAPLKVAKQPLKAKKPLLSNLAG